MCVCVIGSVKYLSKQDYQMIHRVMTPILLLTVRITVCPRTPKRENCPGGGGSFVFFQWYENHGGNGRGLKLAPELLCSGDREWHNKQRKKTHK